MALKFEFDDRRWTIRAGFAPAGSREGRAPIFVEALRAAHPPLRNLTLHALASWIVSRLNFLTSGALVLEGEEFAHDTGEFGYKIRLADRGSATLAHGAVVFGEGRIDFASVDLGVDDFQAVFIKLLVDAPDDLAACEIAVRDPETGRRRSYGRDGRTLLQ